MQRRHALLLTAASLVPAIAAAAQTPRQRRGAPAPLPPAYRAISHQFGIPALIVYGVALQESKLLFGDSALPYPWTLCVRGEARRFSSYEQAVGNLIATVRSGITNVDCGLMQVNWRWNYMRLQNAWFALDPYRNLAVAAGLLKEHLAVTGEWFEAVGRYHHPSDPVRARAYATSVFARLPQIPT
jgi:soluble lytic murein transglycosylase-like protein